MKSNFPNFKLGIGFISDFAKQTSNFPNNLKFIYLELQVSEVSAKSETKKFSLSLFTLHFSLSLTIKQRGVVVRLRLEVGIFGKDGLKHSKLTRSTSKTNAQHVQD